MKKSSPYLDGQLLIAMPSIGDPRFHRAVIYLCAHSDKGAMGLIVNKPAPSIYFADLLDRLDVLSHDERIHLPTEIGALPVQFGGPVEPGRGFVLHTADYFSSETTLPIDEKTGLTATLDILRAIAKGAGPRRKLLALGYSGWGPGQLDEEIQHNGWLHCAADEELMFGGDFDGKYNTALGKIGVDPALLSAEAGHG